MNIVTHIGRSLRPIKLMRYELGRDLTVINNDQYLRTRFLVIANVIVIVVVVVVVVVQSTTRMVAKPTMPLWNEDFVEPSQRSRAGIRCADPIHSVYTTSWDCHWQKAIVHAASMD